MIKTYEIDLEDSLVEKSTEIFETLGTDIDVAIAIFLKQAVLRKGFPFEVVVPEKIENSETLAGGESPCEAEDACEGERDDDLHGGVSEEEECTLATVTSESSVSAEIAARVAANEALVAEMRNEIGDKEVTPEFEQNEDDGTHGDYDSSPTENGELKTENSEPLGVTENSASETENADEAENPPESGPISASEKSAVPNEADEEDEDETTPDNLFDAWDVGDEEEIGCR